MYLNSLIHEYSNTHMRIICVEKGCIIYVYGIVIEELYVRIPHSSEDHICGLNISQQSKVRA
jgi:hypothetical protein